jgi:hypothetical protein
LPNEEIAIKSELSDLIWSNPDKESGSRFGKGYWSFI